MANASPPTYPGRSVGRYLSGAFLDRYCTSRGCIFLLFYLGFLSIFNIISLGLFLDQHLYLFPFSDRFIDYPLLCCVAVFIYASSLGS